MAEDGEFHIVSIDHGAAGWRATLGARSVVAAEAEDALRELCCQELATDPAVWRAVRSREVGEARPTPDLPAVIELVEEIQESADAARGWTGPLSCGRGPQRYEQGYQFPCTHPECIERAATYSYEFARDAAHAANRLAALLSGAASSDATGWQRIVTAPSSTRVLVLQPGGHVSFGWLVKLADGPCWTDDDTGEAIKPVPTHWMPLPAPPATGDATGCGPTET